MMTETAREEIKLSKLKELCDRNAELRAALEGCEKQLLATAECLQLTRATGLTMFADGCLKQARVARAALAKDGR